MPTKDPKEAEEHYRQRTEMAVRLAPTVLQLLQCQDAYHEKAGRDPGVTKVADLAETSCTLARLIWDDIRGLDPYVY